MKLKNIKRLRYHSAECTRGPE
ncbi:hypothetical protein M5689_022799 [Euphorbia peplus]|nr:hypothetical protein M5689_022799 [Euphorbia peplus]